jgi:hypothetical protein
LRLVYPRRKEAFAEHAMGGRNKRLVGIRYQSQCANHSFALLDFLFGMKSHIVVPIDVEVAMAGLFGYILEADETVDDCEDCPSKTETHMCPANSRCPCILVSEVETLWRRNVRQSQLLCWRQDAGEAYLHGTGDSTDHGPR